MNIKQLSFSLAMTFICFTTNAMQKIKTADQAITNAQPKILTQDTKISENFSFEQIMEANSIEGESFWLACQDWLESQWAGKDYTKEREETLNGTRVFEVIWRDHSLETNFADCGTLNSHRSSFAKHAVLSEHIKEKTSILCPCGSILINTKSTSDCALLRQAKKRNNIYKKNI